jgi:hypothetical protein
MEKIPNSGKEAIIAPGPVGEGDKLLKVREAGEEVKDV